MDSDANMPGIVGIGYEGLTANELLARIHDLSINTLVDVRLNAISRKPGLSKRALSKLLTEGGVTYLHMPDLGNPRENRAGFGQAGEELARARATYMRFMMSPGSGKSLSFLAELSTQRRVGLLCFEADEGRCHRQVIVEHIQKQDVLTR